MNGVLDFVVIRSGQGLDSEEGRFALRALRMVWPESTRVLVGMDWRQALDWVDVPEQARGCLLDSVWLTLDLLCLPRLHAALDDGADVALACDSTSPAPMESPSYATMRGMERWVRGQSHEIRPVSLGSEARVELATLRGLRRRQQGTAKIVRVRGAWAHDSSGYFSSAREEVLPLVPPTVVHALDVGGGRGGFLAALKAARPAVVTHLAELTEDAASHARANLGVDHIWLGNFQAMHFEQRFDCISFLDVLEHFEHPEQVLRYALGLLSDGGVVVASIPNVGHWSVVADLIEGRWDWAPAGIHCYTHVRFFTRDTIEKMFLRCGFGVEEWLEVRVPCREDWLARWETTGLARDMSSLETYAYLVRARPLMGSVGQPVEVETVMGVDR